MPPLVKLAGCVMHSHIEKASLFANVFGSKQSIENLDVPLLLFSESKLNHFVFGLVNKRDFRLISILLEL